jgi:hypothetical protein
MGYIISKQINANRWLRMPGVYSTRDHAERDALLYRELGWIVTIDEARMGV